MSRNKAFNISTPAFLHSCSGCCLPIWQPSVLGCNVIMMIMAIVIMQDNNRDQQYHTNILSHSCNSDSCCLTNCKLHQESLSLHAKQIFYCPQCPPSHRDQATDQLLVINQTNNCCTTMIKFTLCVMPGITSFFRPSPWLGKRPAWESRGYYLKTPQAIILDQSPA